MICVYLNSNGYYIKGDGIEAALSCSPSVNSNGEPFYPEVCHVYAVLAKALNELRDHNIQDEVTVFNDSRMIDEMNGVVTPIDSLGQEFRDRIRHEILPEVPATVFFRKKNNKIIERHLAAATASMIDVPHKIKRLTELSEQRQKVQRTKSLRALDRLKEWWKNEQRN